MAKIRKLAIQMQMQALDQRGLSETVQYGGLTILTCVILAGAALLMAPALDTGIQTVLTRIDSTFTYIGGL